MDILVWKIESFDIGAILIATLGFILLRIGYCFVRSKQG